MTPRSMLVFTKQASERANHLSIFFILSPCEISQEFNMSIVGKTRIFFPFWVKAWLGDSLLTFWNSMSYINLKSYSYNNYQTINTKSISRPPSKCH